ncbi:MAG: esterase family protein [Oscillospiraceae bacterium]|jgi:S-formylglutathione hydrolase FrmB|nr:esterase family protein [Oscillospiraceae bacterium]
MAFLELHCYSESLRHQVAVNVLLPQRHPWEPELTGDTRVLYLLHGLGDDHTGWARLTSLERYCMGRNMAVIMPSVFRGFYTDTQYGARYWQYVSRELPSLVKHFFALDPRREDCFAAGLSMGGYGALKLAFLRPERFCAAAALSAAVMGELFRSRYSDTEEDKEMAREFGFVFGDAFAPSDDIFSAASVCASGPLRPALYLSVGADDFIREPFFAFHKHLDALGYAHIWQEHPGHAHTWDYWDSCLPRVLDWFEGAPG